MRPRFHAPDLDPGSGQCRLEGDEAAHLTRVLRLGVGAEVDVFDGRGSMFAARVLGAGRSSVSLQLLSPVTPAAEPQVAVTLVMSVLKGDKMDGVVRDAAMMGAAAIQPIVTVRAETSVAVLARGRRAARWQRIAISAVKQCGRAVVPAVHEPAAFDAWIAQARDGPILALMEPSAGDGHAVGDIGRALSVQLLVGPEGGWAAEEQGTLAAAGAVPVSVGPRTLRADIAPVVAMAVLFEAWRAW